MGAHVAEARAAFGSLSQAWLRARRCHAGLAIGTQREPDWAKAEAEGERSGEAAAKDDQVAERVLAGVAGLWSCAEGHPEAVDAIADIWQAEVAFGNRAALPEGNPAAAPIRDEFL